MTREEAITNLKMIRVAFVNPGTKEQRKLIDDTFEMAIQAISPNQSNACSILDDECPYPHKHCWECPLNYQYMLAKRELDKNVELPSVTQKSGKWIETEYHRWRCSVCREKGMSEWDNIHNVRTNFCPDCGARMVESQESEEQTE